MTDPLLTILKTAGQGMTYPSERDEPLKPFVRQVEEVEPATFFGDLMGEQDPDVNARWTALVRVLNDNLTDLKVRRVHRSNGTQVDIEVVGITKDGKCEAGYRMLSVET